LARGLDFLREGAQPSPPLICSSIDQLRPRKFRVKWTYRVLTEQVWQAPEDAGTSAFARTSGRDLHRGPPVGDEGLSGAVRGRKHRTTTPAGKDSRRAPDLLERDFTAVAPNRRWVTTFTDCRTWSGFVYVAFVIDCPPGPSWVACSRREGHRDGHHGAEDAVVAA
jgi:hypothetical protein